MLMTVYLTPARVLATHSLTTIGSWFAASVPIWLLLKWKPEENMSLGPQNLQETINAMLAEATERESPFSLETSYHYGITYFISETSVALWLLDLQNIMSVLRLAWRSQRCFYTQQVFRTLSVFFWNCSRKYLKKQLENILEELCKRIA